MQAETSRIERLWLNGQEGHLLAIIPCYDSLDLRRAKRGADAFRVANWTGLGFNEFGQQRFLVAEAERNAADQFKAFVQRITTTLHLSLAMAHGFTIELVLAEIVCGQRLIVQHPFPTAATTIDSGNGEIVLSFTTLGAEPKTANEWNVRLAAAYCEIARCRRFRFLDARGGCRDE